jgi:dihydroxyacetone kinase-like protein
MALELDAADFKQITDELAKAFRESEDQLNDLDSKIGDGDHGLSMARGSAATAMFAKQQTNISISDLLMQGGMQFNEAAGSTIGILMHAAMHEAGKAVRGKEKLTLADLTLALGEAIQGIEKRGKASLGQKTILDSLHPALEKLQKGLLDEKVDELQILKAAARAAEDGAEKTRFMQSKIGRARWFAERSHGEIDPGAAAGAIIIRTVVEYIVRGCP